MQTLFSLMTAGTLFITSVAQAPEASLLSRNTEQPSIQKESTARPSRVRRVQGDLLDVQEKMDRLQDTHFADHEALKGHWTSRWGSYGKDITKVNIRHRLSGDTLRCVQVAQKTGKSPGKYCERLGDYDQLMQNCAEDMDSSPYCMPLEERVVQWADRKLEQTHAAPSAGPKN